MNKRIRAMVAKKKMVPESEDDGYAKISIIINTGIRRAPIKVNLVATFLTNSEYGPSSKCFPPSQ